LLRLHDTNTQPIALATLLPSLIDLCVWGSRNPSPVASQAPDFWAETLGALGRIQKARGEYPVPLRQLPPAEAAPAHSARRGKHSLCWLPTNALLLVWLRNLFATTRWFRSRRPASAVVRQCSASAAPHAPTPAGVALLEGLTAQ